MYETLKVLLFTKEWKISTFLLHDFMKVLPSLFQYWMAYAVTPSFAWKRSLVRLLHFSLKVTLRDIISKGELASSKLCKLSNELFGCVKKRLNYQILRQILIIFNTVLGCGVNWIQIFVTAHWSAEIQLVPSSLISGTLIGQFYLVLITV